LKVILGIGNPGVKYFQTRHNIGFTVIDYIAERFDLKKSYSGDNYIYFIGSLANEEFLLVKPLTYVNLSGEALTGLAKKFDVVSENILIIVDDINLKLGDIRVRKSGGDGGHNGLKSIIYILGSEEFSRIRFGIGKNFDSGNQADYVLSKFEDDEIKIVIEKIEFVYELSCNFIIGGIQKMLDLFSKSKNLPSNLNNTEV